MITRGVKEVVKGLGVLKYKTLFKRWRHMRFVKSKRAWLVVSMVSLLTAGCEIGGGGQSTAEPLVERAVGLLRLSGAFTDAAIQQLEEME